MAKSATPNKGLTRAEADPLANAAVQIGIEKPLIIQCGDVHFVYLLGDAHARPAKDEADARRMINDYGQRARSKSQPTPGR